MPFPKRINPDLLKDSIVEIRFTTKLEQRLLIPGLMHGSLVQRGFKLLSNAAEELKPKGAQITLNLGPTQPTYFNDVITCKVTPFGFMFNCKEKYIGWENYKSEIQNVIKLAYDLQFVEVFYRVGLRYINTISSGFIFEKTSDNVSISFKNLEIQNTNLKTEVVEKDFKILVNIGDDYIIQTSQEKVSLLDIDVIHEKPAGYSSIDEMLHFLEECHVREKSLFFSLLNPDFVSSLNPEV